MPSYGVSSRRPVSGAYGVGKVKLKFKERKKIGFPFGFCLYVFCMALIIFHFLWSKQWGRTGLILPLLRALELATERLWNFGSPSLDMLQRKNHILFNLDGSANVTGDSTISVLFSQGYLHASERLFQMDVLGRRMALGTLSEVIGRDGIQSDKLARTFNLLSLAEEDHLALSESERHMLNAYCEGVNSFLREQRALPSEFAVLEYSSSNKSTMIPLWEPVHTLAMMRYFDIERSHGWEVELVEQYVTKELGVEAANVLFGPAYHTDNSDTTSSMKRPNAYCDMDTIHCVPSLNGNSWTVTPGDAAAPSVFTSNIHDKPTYPSRWILNRLISPALSVYGASIPGIPFVYEGNNDVYSWGSTIAANVDTEDLYVEDVVEQNASKNTPLFYRLHKNTVEEAVIQFSIRSSVIRVKVPRPKKVSKKFDLTSVLKVDPKIDNFEYIRFDVEESVHGPVITANDMSSRDHNTPLDDALVAGSRRGYGYAWREGTLLQALTSTLQYQSDISTTHAKLSLCSQALQRRINFNYLFGVNTAQSFGEFKTAVRSLTTTALNVIYTGPDGVGYVVSGRVPIRASHHQVNAMTPSSGSAGQEWRDDSPEGDLPLPHLFLPRQSITSTVIVAAVEDTSVGYRVLDKLAAHLYPSVGQYCQNDNTCSVGGQSDKKTRTVATESLEVISENVMNDDFSPSAVRIKKLILSHMDTSSGSDACQHYMCSGCEFLITSMLKDFEGRYSQTSGGASTAPLLIELFRQHLWASVSTASLKEVTQSLLYGNNDFSYHLFKASTLPRYGADWLLDLLDNTPQNGSVWIDNVIKQSHLLDIYPHISANITVHDKKHHLVCQTIGRVLNDEAMIKLKEETKPKSAKTILFSAFTSGHSYEWASLHHIRREHIFDTLYGYTGVVSEVYSRAYAPIAGTVDSIFRSSYAPSAFRTSRRVTHLLNSSSNWFTALIKRKESISSEIERASMDRLSLFPTMGAEPFSSKRTVTVVPSSSQPGLRSPLTSKIIL